MKLQVPFLQLPIQFDTAALQEDIARLGESAWRPHPQGFAGNSAIPLIARDGDPRSDAVQGPMRPTPELERCPYLIEVLHALGAVWGRSRLMRLSGQAEVTAHVDIDYYWREHMRVHVPVITSPEVQFHCGDQATHMAAGECWIFDTWKAHKVLNPTPAARIHLVADTVGGDGLWHLIGGSRMPDHSPPGWRAHAFQSDPVGVPRLRVESFNVPTVMTPWEVKEHLGFVLDDALEHPALGVAHQLVGQFCRHWRALWAEFGESAAGWPAYCDARDVFVTELQRISSGIRLHNGAELSLAMRRLVADVAVNVEEAAQADERSAPV